MEQKKNKSKLMIILAILIVVIGIIVGIVVFTNKDKGAKENEKITEMSKDEMIGIAEELNFNDVQENCEKNPLRAKEQYINKIYKVNCFASEIRDEYVVYRGIKNNNSVVEITMYLNNEEIKKFNKGDGMSIVGKINNLEYTSQSAGQYYIKCEIKNSYVVSNDTLEIIGTIGGIEDKKTTAFTYSLPSGIICERLERHGEFTDIILGEDQWECKLYASECIYDLTDCVPKKNRKFKDQGKTTINNIKVGNGDKVKIVGKAKEENGIQKIVEIKSIEKVK